MIADSIFGVLGMQACDTHSFAIGADRFMALEKERANA
jgi:hypothetical protein